MEYIKSFIVTIVTTVILFSAIELISPSNSMKKYIKFVLGLILIIVMLNPIIDFFTNGEDTIVSTIREYENVLSTNGTSETEVAASSEVKDVFLENLNKNCENELKAKFVNYDFTCDIDCNVDFNDMTYVIEHAKIEVASKNIKEVESVKKVEINNESNTEASSREYTDDEKAIIKYTEELLNITADKIEIFTVR